METIRKPAVAGMFYPNAKKLLQNDIEFLLDSTKPDENLENIFGLIAPHAGYQYSGKTAASVYNYIRNKDYQTVVVISPSHREYFPGTCIYEGDAYKTPLGIVPVNDKIRAKLIEGSTSIFSGTHGHNMEHALEVQLPFLQVALNDFSIVPIVMGDQSNNYIDELAGKLAEVTDTKTLIVASSDLSHFHTKQEADLLDSRIEKNIAEFDYESLLKNLSLNLCEACGGGPIAAMMKTAKLKGHNNSKIIARSDSGDISGDNSEVVGYLSAVIF
jgi:hypothetical protein